VAPDGEYQLAHNERHHRYFVTPSQTQRGFKRARAEISAWHFPPEERGKPVQKMRPKPVFDDIVTTIRYGVARWGVPSAPLTMPQRIEQALPDENRQTAISQLPADERSGAMHKRQILIKEIERRDEIKNIYDARTRAKIRRRRGRR
jgi:hypothetical protein